jgi:hypothetical protein
MVLVGVSGPVVAIALAIYWHMEPESGALRWSDGTEWTDRYNTWSGARPKQSHRAV